MSETQQVELERPEPKYYSRIPHMALDIGLSHAAFHLYCWYKRVCGVQNKRCFQSLDYIAERCSMSRSTIVKARKDLEEVRLIRVKRVTNKYGIRTIVTIVDVWEENIERYDEQKKLGQKQGVQTGTTPNQEGVQTGTTPVQTGTRGGTNGYGKKNPYKNNPKKKNRLAGQAGRSRNGGLFSDEFDRKAGAFLRSILVQHDADIVHKYKVRVDTLAKQFTRLRVERKIPKKEIGETLKWYGQHYGERFVRDIHTAEDIFVHWQSIVKQKKMQDQDQARENGEETEQSPARLKTLSEIRRRLADRGQYEEQGYPVNPSNLRRVLAEMELGEDSFGVSEI